MSANDTEQGMVTAEIAVALPAVIAVCALVIGLAQAGAGTLRACDLARESARAAAIGAPPPPDRPGLTVAVTREGSWMHARAGVSVPHLLAGVAAPLSCEAHALAESSVVGP